MDAREGYLLILLKLSKGGYIWESNSSFNGLLDAMYADLEE